MKYSLSKSQGGFVALLVQISFSWKQLFFCKNLSQSLPQGIFLQSTHHKAELQDLSMVSNGKQALSEKGEIQDPAASDQNCPLKKFLSLSSLIIDGALEGETIFWQLQKAG